MGSYFLTSPGSTLLFNNRRSMPPCITKGGVCFQGLECVNDHL